MSSESAQARPAVAAVEAAREDRRRRRSTMWPARAIAALGVLVALWGVMLTASILWGWVWGTNGPNRPRSMDSLPQLLQFEQEGGTVMTVLDLPVWVRGLSAAPGLVQALMLAGAAFLLARVLVDIANGHSFSKAVQQRLGRIGWLLIIGSLLVTALDILAIFAITTKVTAYIESVGASGELFPVSSGQIFRVLWLPLALGVVAFALRWAFKDGARLEKEAEGVI